MSREIKFRAWHKKEKQMYWFDPLWGNCYGSGGGYVGMLPMDQEKIEYRFYRPDSRIDVDPTECEIMQFTGLLDKNGKEIWEGDLIKNTSRRICEVIWFQPAGTWDADPKHSIGNAIGFNPASWKDCVEVIGNIFENPGLLKDSLADEISNDYRTPKGNWPGKNCGD